MMLSPRSHLQTCLEYGKRYGVCWWLVEISKQELHKESNLIIYIAAGLRVNVSKSICFVEQKEYLGY